MNIKKSSIFLIATILMVAGCATSNKGAATKHKSAVAVLYIDPELRNYKINEVGGSSSVSVFEGIKTSNKYNVPFGPLSTAIYAQALGTYFQNVRIIKSPNEAASLNPNEYLVKLKLDHFNLGKNTLSRSDINISYNLSIENNTHQEVYQKTVFAEGKGHFKSMSATSAFGIPLSLNADMEPDESDKIKEAIKSAANSAVKEIEASGAIK